MLAEAALDLQGGWSPFGNIPAMRGPTDLMYLLTRAERLLARRLSGALEAERCTPDAWRVLTVLADGKGHFMTELSDAVFLPPGSLTRLIDHLVEANLAYRRGDDVDRRRIRVHLAARGRRLRERVEHAIREDLAGLPLPAEDQIELAGRLGDLIAALDPEERTGVAPAGASDGRSSSNVNHMADLYSRRSFIAGVLTAGVASTSASFLLTRREQVVLTLATGAEPTGGGRELLTTLWNQQNPDIRIAVNEINSSTQDQFAKFTERPADIYNLDVIHIPRFAAAGRIVPIAPRNDISLLAPVRQVVGIPGENERLWAVPYNTDVGMLYRRITDKRAADPEPDLKDVLAGGSFAGQLDTVGIATDEAFVVNVLEHALAQDESILAPDGVVSFSLGQWKTALAPLAEAVRRRRLWTRPVRRTPTARSRATT